uniref:MBD domain-containing protein n=1 Tax=Cacopsylla melanoneura TaxID=428564 RepID=A0A8D8S6L7_9HEMI
MEEIRPPSTDAEETGVSTDKTKLTADKSPADDDVMDVDNETAKEAVNEAVQHSEPNVDMEKDNTNTSGEESAEKNVDSKTHTTNQPEEGNLGEPNEENMVGTIENTSMPDRDEDSSGPNEETGNVVSESKTIETENDSTSIIPTDNREDSDVNVKEHLDDSINKSEQDIQEAEQSKNPLDDNNSCKDSTSKEANESKDCVLEGIDSKEDVPVEDQQTSDTTSDIKTACIDDSMNTNKAEEEDTTTACIDDTMNKKKAEEEQMESESIEDVQKYIDDTSNSNEAGDNKSGAECIDSRNENKLEVDSIGATTNETKSESNESDGASNQPMSSNEIPKETVASSELKLNEVETDNQSEDTRHKLSDDPREEEEITTNAVESVDNVECKTYATLENMEINTKPVNEELDEDEPLSSRLDSFDCQKQLNITNSTKEPQVRALAKTLSSGSTKKNESPKRRAKRDPVSSVMPHAHFLDNETHFSGFYPEYYDSTIYMYRGYWCYVQDEFNIPCRPLPSYKTSFYVNYIPSTQPVVHTSSGRVVKKKEMKDFTPSVPNSHQTRKEKEPVSNSVKKEKESLPNHVKKEKEVSTPKKPADTVAAKKELSRRKYRLPLEKYGWKREIVFRTNAHSPNHTADVYYYSPSGRKLRSIREIIDTLPEDDELKPFHFTFVKEPLGFEPPLEISREAISRTLTSCDEDTPKRGGKTPKNYRKVFFDKNNSNVLTPPSGAKSKTETLSPLNGKLKNSISPSGGIKRSHDEMENDKTQASPVKTLSPTNNGDIRKTPDTGKSTGKSNQETPVKTNHKTQGEASVKRSKSNSHTSKPVHSKHAGDQKKPQSDSKTPNSVAKHKASDTSVHTPSNKKRKMEVIEPTSRAATPAPVVNQSPPVYKIVHSNKNLINDVSNQFNAVVHLCKYLRVEDLLRVARVNRLFNAAAHSHQLWQLVKLKNSKVRDWTGLADCLTRHRTHTLDMLKMIGSADPDENDEIWNRFYKVIGKIHSLKRLELGRVTAAEILNAASNCSKNLTEFSVIAQKLATIDLKLFQGLPNLEILQLRSFESKREHGLIMMNIPLLSNMKHLRHLSLTGVKNLKSYQVNVLKDFPPLVSLELGDCTKLDERFPECSLAPLTSLVRLRLEMVQGNMANKFVEVIATLPRLKTLELINIDTKKGFDEVFGRLSHVEHLLIFPTYITQSSTTNWLVLSGLARLKASLQFLTWGLTQELLRVTTLFIEQWNAQLNLDDGVSKLDPEELKKTIVESNSIPVMKPLPELFETVHSAGKAEGSKQNISELDILPIDELKTMLEKVLCDTKIKLITVPVSSTTRIYLPTN